MANLAKAFRDMDEDGSKCLSLSEFKKGIYGFGIELEPNDLRLLFNSFDKDGNGQLSYNEFMVVVRGEISSERLRLVRQAFMVLDRTGTGTIDIEDVQQAYDPGNHPDVKTGEMSPDEALASFLDAFDSEDHDGHVTIEEFLDYYTNGESLQIVKRRSKKASSCIITFLLPILTIFYRYLSLRCHRLRR